MWALVHEQLDHVFRANPGVAAVLDAVEGDVVAGRRTAPGAARDLLDRFGAPHDAKGD
jgi:hypothetical protein